MPAVFFQNCSKQYELNELDSESTLKKSNDNLDTTNTTSPTSPTTASGSTTTSPKDGTWGKTYYIRPDGGTSAQCDGTVDAPLQGAINKKCSWNSYFSALPPRGTAAGFTDPPAGIAGGDKLIIKRGDFKIGKGAADSEGCTAGWDSRECYPIDIPSGPDADHPTRIFGEGYDQGCSSESRPKLYATKGLRQLISMKGSSNVVLSCLDLSSRGGCYQHPGFGSYNCSDINPNGDWGLDGIRMGASQNVTLQDLNVHGFAGGGIGIGTIGASTDFSQGITNMNFINVRIAYNGVGGVGFDSPLRGKINLKKVLVEWNGCTENYPSLSIGHCHDYYGDGFGGSTTGGDWLIEDSIFRYNISDGLDLLYHSLGGEIIVNRVRAEGNAGNQLKVKGSSTIMNSVIIGNCNHFYNKPYTESVNNCRALGDALSVSVQQSGEKVNIYNNTVISAGNTVLYAGASSQVPGFLNVVNNIFIAKLFTIGATTANDQPSADIYPEPNGNTWTVKDFYNLKVGTRNTSCSGNGVICASTAGLKNETLELFDPHLNVSSPALGTGLLDNINVGLFDFYLNPRISSGKINRGAVQ